VIVTEEWRCTKHYYSDQIKEEQRAGRVARTKESYVIFWLESLKVRDHSVGKNYNGS